MPNFPMMDLLFLLADSSAKTANRPNSSLGNAALRKHRKSIKAIQQECCAAAKKAERLLIAELRVAISAATKDIQPEEVRYLIALKAEAESRYTQLKTVTRHS